jgi:iron(III) transport system ATP-binding protein
MGEAKAMGQNGGAEQKAYLRIRDLTKKFGEFTALKDISLDVYDGEFVCFLGPSGCGKTTLLRAIAGLDIQSTGTIAQGERDISALPPSERDFGIVFQSYALFPNLTVRKNVGYGLENRKLPKSEVSTRVDELLDLVGMPEQGDKYPAQLSGGQQQRVALARAMATSPGLHLRHEVKDLQRRLGVTTIMVTHDQEEALTMADRIVVMNQGVIEQVGTPVEIYRSPTTAFVADFIGTMNFVPGTVVGPERVRLGQVELSCDADGHAQGASVTIAVRPEDIVVQGVSEEEDNVIDVKVDAMEFLGSFFRADLADGAMGEARLRADFSINLVRRLGIEEGHSMNVRVPRLGIEEGHSMNVRVPRECIRIYAGSATHG